MLTRAQISALIPQAGSMCLLDRVAHWNEAGIVCHSDAPGATHPFACGRGVPAVAAIEYAAQAAAVHGALLDDSREPRHGVLATLSEVELNAGWLDRASGTLIVEAQLLVRSMAGCKYSFAVHDAHGCRVRGRLLVAFTQ